MPVNELLASTRPASAQSQASASQLPTNTEVPAQVRSVKPDPQQAGQFRVQVQVQLPSGPATLELVTRQPPSAGSQVQLVKTDQGRLQMQIPAPQNAITANTSQQGVAAETSAQTLRLPVPANTAPLRQLIAAMQPQQTLSAQVLQSQPSIPLPIQAGSISMAPASTGGAAPGAALKTTNTSTQGLPASGNSTSSVTNSATQTASLQTLQLQLQLTGQSNQAALPKSGIQIQLPANIPIPPGSQVQLERTQQGALVIRVPAPAPQTASSPSGNTAIAGSLTTQLPIQAPEVQTRLNQLLPLRAPVPGQIIPTQNTTAQTAASPAIQITSIPVQAATVQPGSQSATAAPLNSQVQSAAQQTPQPAPSSPAGLLATSTQAAVGRGAVTPASYPVTVQLAQAPVQLNSPQPLQVGLNVQLTRQSTSEVQLQPQPLIPQKMPLADTGANLAAQAALREALPNQIPLASGLNQLNQLAQQAPGSGALDKAVKALFQALSIQPGTPQTSQQVQSAVQHSGQFTELQLARGQQSPLPDVKQVLGQLLQQSEQLPAQAREQMQQLIQQLQARATSQQITSLQQWRELPDGTMERNFRFDLPVQNGQRHENVDMQLQERQSKADRYSEPESHWRLRLHFDLRPAGSLDVELTLENEVELGATFWSESQALINQLQAAQQDFAHQLNQDGFQVQALHIRQGSLKEPQRPALERRLVDIRT